MRLVTYQKPGGTHRAGAFVDRDRTIVDLQLACTALTGAERPEFNSVLALVEAGEEALKVAAELVAAAAKGTNEFTFDDTDFNRWVWTFTIALAIAAAFLTALLVLPAMRVSRTTRELYQATTTPRLTRGFVLVTFFAPAAAAALWLRPVLADQLLPKDLVKCGAEAVARDCRVLNEGSAFL